MLDTVKNILSAVALPAFVLGGALAFGGPSTPSPIDAIAAPFDAVDFSTMPAPSRFEARDGEALAYRRYDGAPERIVVALHGSAGSSVSLHPLAQAVAEVGPTVVAVDLRGHGLSGPRGDVDHIGQAEEDLADLIAHLRAGAPEAAISLVGFSMGGGLALKFAAGRDDLEEVILIAPYLAHDAPPMVAENPNAPEVRWAAAGVARIVGLSALNHIGVTALNGLTTVRLAVRDDDRDIVADRYSFRLMKSMNPVDWRADLAAVEDRLTLIAGGRDGLHLASAYAEALARHAPAARFIEIETADHMGLTLAPAPLAALADLVAER